MGRGDKKSKKGKIFRKSRGNTRPKRNTVIKAKALRKRQAAEQKD